MASYLQSSPVLMQLAYLSLLLSCHFSQVLLQAVSLGYHRLEFLQCTFRLFN